MAKKKNTKRAEPTIPETLNTPEFTAVRAEWLQFTQERGMPLGDDRAPFRQSNPQVEQDHGGPDPTALVDGVGRRHR